MVTSDHLHESNKHALEKRVEQDTEFAGIPLSEKMRRYPYFGFITIDLGSIDPFLMFSSNDDFVACSFFWHGCYEPASLSLWLELAQQANPIIDIGAYTGLYSLAAAIASPESKILALEPLDRAFARLVVNRSVNGLHRIAPLQIAAGSANGTAKLNVFRGAQILTTGASIRQKERKTFDRKIVAVKTVDTLLADLGSSNIALAKIDVEGSELDVLSGMEDSLGHMKPDMLIEILDDVAMRRLVDFLRKQGYSGYTLMEEELAICPIEHSAGTASQRWRNAYFTVKNLEEVIDVANKVNLSVEKP